MYYMDHELEDKENNLRIDRHNLTLKETSLNLSLYHGNARLDPSYESLHSIWIKTLMIFLQFMQSASGFFFLISTYVNLVLNISLSFRTITLAEWEMQTNNNIIAASKEVNSARPMRCYIDTILKQIIDDLKAQKEATDEAFRKRIEETKEAKTKLELQHSEV